MDVVFGIDWEAVLLPDTPLLEIFVRGSLMYLGMFLLLRVILKRQAGTIGISDLLVIVLIADAAQNGMADDYKSVPDGLLLVATLIFWNFALEWLGYHIPVVGRLTHPPALLLVKEGQLMRDNLRHELMTKAELMSQLREQGIEDIRKVKSARMEGDGRISVVTYDEEQKPNNKEQQVS